jgi:ATP-dependent DNA ligase
MPVHHLLERILDEFIVLEGLHGPLYQSVNSAGTEVTGQALNRGGGEERVCAAPCTTRFSLVKTLIVDDRPFVNLPEKKTSRWNETLTAEKTRKCWWVEPVLVFQMAFVEWTDGDKLRHCTFVGMRKEKATAKVIREA